MSYQYLLKNNVTISKEASTAYLKLRRDLLQTAGDKESKTFNWRIDSNYSIKCKYTMQQIDIPLKRKRYQNLGSLRVLRRILVSKAKIQSFPREAATRYIP